MSIMFRNSNAALEKELAAEDYRAHPVRNRIAVFAVALTAILIVVTFTVGIGFVNAEARAMGASPGPGADSAMIYGDEQVLRGSGRFRRWSGRPSPKGAVQVIFIMRIFPVWMCGCL